jgi:hypothetical protein
VDWRAHHTALDRAIHAVFGGPAPLRTHALLAARARGGEVPALGELIANALDWRVDWWNAEPNPEALDAVIALAAARRAPGDALLRELGCARRVVVAAAAPAVRSALEGAALLLPPHPYPTSSEVGKYLVERVVALGLAEAGTLLGRFGAELTARAQSAAGDRAALEGLAFLQVRARDEAGLARSDELGWRRYRIQEFALSRVTGLLVREDAATKAQGRTLLAEALREFPDEARLLGLDFGVHPPGSTAREAALVRLILAEYRGLQNGERTARALRALVEALAKERPPRA